MRLERTRPDPLGWLRLKPIGCEDFSKLPDQFAAVAGKRCVPPPPVDLSSLRFRPGSHPQSPARAMLQEVETSAIILNAPGGLIRRFP